MLFFYKGRSVTSGFGLSDPSVCLTGGDSSPVLRDFTVIEKSSDTTVKFVLLIPITFNFIKGEDF
jgi:hypothetical protein